MDGTLKDSVDALHQSWILGWNAQILLDNPVALYEAPIFYPYPHTLAYMDSMVPQSLLALPIVLATGNPAFAYNLQVIFTFVLSGLAMYWLVRDWGGNLWGALIAGIFFAFGHYRLAHFGHLNLLSIQWLPLMLIYLERALSRGGGHNWFMYALFFVLSALSSFYYAFFVALVAGIHTSISLVWQRGRFSRATLQGLLASSALAFLIILPFGIPYIEVARDYARTRSLSEVISYSAIPTSYLVSATNTPALAWIRRYFPAQQGETLLSPGWIALALAFYGFYHHKHSRRSLTLVGIGLAGFVLSLGPQVVLGQMNVPLPYQLLYQFVPGVGGSMRAVSRWGVLVLFAVAALGGLGFSELVRRIAATRALAIGITLLAVAVLFLEYNQAPLQSLQGRIFSEPVPQGYKWLASQVTDAAVELPMGAPSDRYPPDTFYQYYTLIHHKPLINGYSGFIPPFYDQIVRRFNSFPSYEAVELARALRVRYVIVHSDTFPEWDSVRERLDDLDSVRLIAAFDTMQIFEILSAPETSDPEFEIVLAEPVAPSFHAQGYIIAQATTPHTIRLTPRGNLELHLEWRGSDNQTRHTETIRVVAPLTLDEHAALMPFTFTAPESIDTYRVHATIKRGSESAFVDKVVKVEPNVTNETQPAAQLESWNIPQRAARAGETLDFILQWRIRNTHRDSFTVFAHLQNAKGETVGEFLGGTSSGHSLSTLWNAGTAFVVPVAIPLSRRAAQGEYRLLVGLYDPAKEKVVPVLGPDGTTEDVLDIGTVHVAADRNQAPPTPRVTFKAQFSNGSDLRGFDVANVSYAGGQTVPFTLYWFAREPMAEDQTVFVHLVNARGDIVAQADGPPRGGTYPTSAWNAMEWIRDEHELQLPTDIPAGKYTLRIGWYKPEMGRRAQVMVDTRLSDHVDLGTIIVK